MHIHFVEVSAMNRCMYAGCRYRLQAACTVMGTAEQLQDGLRRTVQAEGDSLAAATVCLGASELPDAGRPVAELCRPGSDVLDARILTPPRSCSDKSSGTQLPAYCPQMHSRKACVVSNWSSR